MPMDTDRAGTKRLLSAPGWLGVALGLSGAVLLFLGWWGVSGESAVGSQLPYLASASIPGAALVIAGAALLSSESARRGAADSARMISTLFELLTAAAAEAPPSSTLPSSAPPSSTLPSSPGDDGLLMVPGGNRYHRSGCVLVEDKPGVIAVDADVIAQRQLRPCPICSPAHLDQ